MCIRDRNRACGLPDGRDLGYSGFVRLRFRQRSGGKVANTWTQTLYLTHGAGGGRLAGAKALKLERMRMAWDADIYAQGHTHAKLVLQKRAVGLSPRTLELIDKRLVMVNVGAFMDGKHGYAEQKGYYPQETGPVELWFYPSRQEIRVIQ
jgi:hypothetical protein